ncbi:MAG: TadE family protein [Actinomycetota bacterium]
MVLRSSSPRRLPRARGSRPAPPRGERGAVALEFAIVFPMVLLLTFGGVQVAFWFQARSMCQAAAQAGVRAGRVLGAPAGAGRTAATAYLAATAGDTVGGALLSESHTATSVRVGCSGTALRVVPLPGLPLDVAQSAAAGRERFSHR